MIDVGAPKDAMRRRHSSRRYRTFTSKSIALLFVAAVTAVSTTADPAFLEPFAGRDASVAEASGEHESRLFYPRMNSNALIMSRSAKELRSGAQERHDPGSGSTGDVFRIDWLGDELHALETVGVNWVTRRDVQSVDLYYSIDPERHPSSWVKINTEGPYRENVGQGRTATTYPWVLPNLESETAWLRIQDHVCGDKRFAVDQQGPYSDFGPFAIRYYEIVWRVCDKSSSNQLDRLSVSDSSGWSASDIVSPVVHRYPYGTWSTVWYREGYGDTVAFNWVSDHNGTNCVAMPPSKTEPGIQVLANFAFVPSETNFTAECWLESSGSVVEKPETSRVQVFDASGALVEELLSHENRDGVFRQYWDVKATADRLNKLLNISDMFFARVEILHDGTWYRSGLTFTLRVAACPSDPAGVGEGEADVMYSIPLGPAESPAPASASRRAP